VINQTERERKVLFFFKENVQKYLFLIMLPVILFGADRMPFAEDWNPPSVYKICQKKSDWLRSELLKPYKDQKKKLVKKEFQDLMSFMRSIPEIQEAYCFGVSWVDEVYKRDCNSFQKVPNSRGVHDLENSFSVLKLFQERHDRLYMHGIAILPSKDFKEINQALSCIFNHYSKTEEDRGHASRVDSFFLAGSILYCCNARQEYITQWENYLEEKLADDDKSANWEQGVR